MPYCRNCGTKLIEGARFCKNCGAAISQQGNSSPNPQSNASYTAYNTPPQPKPQPQAAPQPQQPQPKPKKKKIGCILAIVIPLGILLTIGLCVGILYLAYLAQ